MLIISREEAEPITDTLYNIARQHLYRMYERSNYTNGMEKWCTFSATHIRIDLPPNMRVSVDRCMFSGHCIRIYDKATMILDAKCIAVVSDCGDAAKVLYRTFNGVNYE